MQDVLLLDFLDGIELIHYIHEKEMEDRLYQRWLIGRYEREMSFEQFKENAFEAAKQVTQYETATIQTSDEILMDVKNILDRGIEV